MGSILKVGKSKETKKWWESAKESKVVLKNPITSLTMQKNITGQDLGYRKKKDYFWL